MCSKLEYGLVVNVSWFPKRLNLAPDDDDNDDDDGDDSDDYDDDNDDDEDNGR